MIEKRQKDRRVLRLRLGGRAMQGQTGSKYEETNVSVHEGNGQEKSSWTGALLLTANVWASCRQAQSTWGVSDVEVGV